MRIALACALVVAAAAPVSADNVAKADALFAEGIKLRDSNLEQACAKFGESLQYNPQAIGTLMNVALCDERMGRVASALRRFQEARERAVELNFPEHLVAADQKIAALAPEVPHLTLRFTEPPLPQTKVVIDDRVYALGALDRLPVDPGDRVVVVTAPGRIAFQRKVRIEKREHRDIEIPRLAKAVVSSRRTIGKITLASGAVATVTGLVLGYVAHRRYERQFDNRNCFEIEPSPLDPSPDPACNGTGQSNVKSARTLGNVGTVVGTVGVAAMVAGGALWLFSPKPTSGERKTAIIPHVSPTGAGLAVFGRF